MDWIVKKIDFFFLKDIFIALVFIFDRNLWAKKRFRLRLLIEVFMNPFLSRYIVYLILQNWWKLTFFKGLTTFNGWFRIWHTLNYVTYPPLLKFERVIWRTFLTQVQPLALIHTPFLPFQGYPNFTQPVTDNQMTLDLTLLPLRITIMGMGITDNAGHQIIDVLIIWNMTMMSDYWINVYFVLQFVF